jgi:hypothetical protein
VLPTLNKDQSKMGRSSAGGDVNLGFLLLSVTCVLAQQIEVQEPLAVSFLAVTKLVLRIVSFCIFYAELFNFDLGDLRLILA